MLRASLGQCWSWLDRQALALSTPILRRIIIFGLLPAVLNEPLLSLLGMWGFTVWFVPRTYRHRAALLRLQELDRKLMVRLERALADAQNSSADEGAAVFRRVGLSDNVRLHVARAARRSFRSKLHPDGHPEHRKQEASRRFQECEKLFDEIWFLRDWSGKER